jgi:hypothetical protein
MIAQAGKGRRSPFRFFFFCGPRRQIRVRDKKKEK